jgi:undecaprenyl-diphosphatase
MRAGHDDEIRHNHVLLWLLAIGTVPAGIAGLLFQKKLEAAGDASMHLMIGGLMIAVGVVLWIAEAAARRVRDLASLSLPDALAIGLAQALAVVPGCSRSGITIGIGLFRGLTREAAARFSFLLSTPIIAAAAAKALYDLHKQPGGLHAFLDMNFFVGVAVSAVTGWIVIAWFLRYLRRSSLRPFVYYRIIFGIIVLALAFIRRPA